MSEKNSREYDWKKELDIHTEDEIEINGKRLKVYLGGEGLSRWCNTVSIEASDIGIGKRFDFKIDDVKNIFYALPNGGCLWVDCDEQGFCAIHAWIVYIDPLSTDEILRAVKMLAKELIEENKELFEGEEE